MSLVERRQMVEQPHPLSLVSQCNLLSLHRSGWYYQPVAVASEDLALMVQASYLQHRPGQPVHRRPVCGRVAIQWHSTVDGW